MKNGDDEQTILGPLLKEFRASSQTSTADKRPSLYVAPTFSQRTPTVAHKRTFSDVDMITSGSSLKRARDDDDDTADSTTTPAKSDGYTLVPGSPWEVRRLRGDLVVAQAEVAALECQMKNLHSLREVAEVAFRKERDVLVEQLENERQKARDLEKRNQELRLRVAASKSELNEVKQELFAVKSKLERDILSYRKENSNLKDSLMELKRSCEEKMRASRAERTAAEMQINYAHKRIESLTNHVKDRDSQISKFVEEQKLLEEKVCQLEGFQFRTLQLERELQEIRNAKREVLSKQEKLRNYLSMEEDNRLLRAKNKELHDLLCGKMLLEEQVNNLRDQLQGVDEIENRAARNAQENTQLRALLDICKELVLEPDQAQASDTQGYDAVPTLLKRRLEALWDKHKAAVDEKLETINNWRECERKLDRLSGELEKATKQVEKLQTAHDQQTSLIRRLQKKLLLISRERDSYRQQLDMFERDLTITPQTAEQKETASRIESQERTITMYREMLEKMEEELGRLQSSADAGKWEEKLRKAVTEKDAMAAERDKEVKRRKEVEKKLDAWAVQAFTEDHQQRLLTIGLKDNPVRWAVACRTAELNELRTECKKLRAKVRLLKQGDEEVTQNLEDQEQIEKELEELRSEVKSNEVKMLRLKEAFRNTSQEYRETIHMLMGYTVDRVGHQQYKLLSVYAESPSDYLMFKLNTKGSLDLLETPFSKTLKDMMDFHLKQQASIPMFMSGLTEHLFHKQSMNSSSMGDKDTMSLCSMAE